VYSASSGFVLADDHEPATEEQAQPLKLKDVVVTATKEGEVDLQEVPASITAYTSEKLADSGVDNIEGLRLQTPGLNLTRNGEATRLYLRGVGTNLDFIGSDPSVTVHVDGVYQSRTTTALNDFLDVERVEVLRGPQGTLYGRNSTGGTINVISKLPEAETKAQVSAEVGSYNTRRFGASLSGAISGDKLLGGFAIAKTDHDPYVDNINPVGVDGLMDDDSLSTKGTLRSIMGDTGEFILRADYSDIDRTSGAYKPTLLDHRTNPNGDPSPLAGGVVLPDDPFTMNISVADPSTEQTVWGTSAELNLKLSPSLSLTSLTAYRDLEIELKEDTDGSNLAALVTELEEEQSQVSEELRLNYKGENLSWVAGLYYLTEEHDSDVRINSVVTFDTKNETQSYAVFGQGTYALTPKLNTTLGLRYSDEKKEFKNLAGHPVTALEFSLDESKSWDSWSPKAVVDYTYDNGTMVYGSVSRGFKSGGYNVTSGDAEFAPEKVWSYELGTKMETFGDKLRTNLAVFYYDYQDLQVSGFTSPGVLSISNAADATIQGFEIENQWMPTYNLLFELNYAFLDATYDKYFAPNPDGLGGVIDVSGDHLIASPRHKINLAAQTFTDLSEGTLSYRFEYAWQDEQNFTAPKNDVSYQGSYALLNLRASYQTADEQWQVQAYVENLTNKAYSTSSREFPAATVGITKDINPPRTVGMKMVYNFM